MLLLERGERGGRGGGGERGVVTFRLLQTLSRQTGAGEGRLWEAAADTDTG